MDPRFFRKYADLVESAEKNKPIISEAILSEGFLTTVAQKLANKLMSMLDPKTQEALAVAVKDATGGNYALTADNAMKVAAALGFDQKDAKAEDDGKEAELSARTGQVYRQTSYNTRGGVYYIPNTNEPGPDQSKALRKNYAGIGFVYDSQRDAFISPKPFASWVLNEISCDWDAPIPKPTDGKFYRWNEKQLTWVEVVNETN